MYWYSKCNTVLKGLNKIWITSAAFEIHIYLNMQSLLWSQNWHDAIKRLCCMAQLWVSSSQVLLYRHKLFNVLILVVLLRPDRKISQSHMLFFIVFMYLFFLTARVMETKCFGLMCFKCKLGVSIVLINIRIKDRFLLQHVRGDVASNSWMEYASSYLQIISP